LPWFRRRKKESDVAAADAAAPALQAQPEPHVIEARAGDGAAATTDPTKPKRRRGTRGGKGRKKPGAPTTGEPAEAATKPQASRPEKKPQERKAVSQRQERRRSQGGSRRREAPRRAPLPQAKRELIVSVDVGEQRVAVLEDDKVAEVYLERPERRSIAGNIYLGVVDNVLPGMEAAFVEIGLEKNGFLYVDEIIGPELEGSRKSARKITDLIQRGEKILVQAVKDPMKTKGARLTTEISLPGRFVVYVPHGEGLGVSRRLEDDERNRLKAILKEHAPKKGGVIVRTAAEGAAEEELARDVSRLSAQWENIKRQSKTANVLLAVEAGRRWAAEGITANAVHPGVILETGLSRHMPAEALSNVLATNNTTFQTTFKTVGQGAATSVVVATSPDLNGVTGRYFEDCQRSEILPEGTPDIAAHASGVAWYALDPARAQRLWELSEELIGASRA